MTAPTPRRRARELVLQGLYERQISAGADDAIFASLTESKGYARADPVYFAELWRGVTREYPALIEALVPAVDRGVRRSARAKHRAHGWPPDFPRSASSSRR